MNKRYINSFSRHKAGPATDAQKVTLNNLMRDLELDRKTVTLMHVRHGVSQRFVGLTVDAFLSQVDKQSASEAIASMKRALQ